MVRWGTWSVLGQLIIFSFAYGCKVGLNGRYWCPWVFLGHWKDCCALILWHFFGVGLMQYGDFDWLSGYRWPLARDHTLGCVIHQHVGEPTPLSLSTAELCATMGNYWYKSNWRNIPTSLWRGTEWSGGLVVQKRSFTVSLRLLHVFSGFCVGVVCCFGWFCFWTSSLLHIDLLSNSLRSFDRPCHELDRQTLQKKVMLLYSQWSIWNGGHFPYWRQIPMFLLRNSHRLRSFCWGTSRPSNVYKL